MAATRRPEVICGVELFFSEYFNFVYVFIAFMTVAFLSATQIQFKVFTISVVTKLWSVLIHSQ